MEISDGIKDKTIETKGVERYTEIFLFFPENFSLILQ